MTRHNIILQTNSPVVSPGSLTMTLRADGPRTICLSDDERDSGVMSDKKLYDALEAFFTDGLVVVENAIDVAIIDRLNDRMLEDTKKLLGGGHVVQYK